MPDVLTGDLDRADALVDLSNVLRNTGLGGNGPADLVRLERVGEALTRLYGATQTLMFGAADNSLLTRDDLFLDAGQRRKLRDWAESGLILADGKADVPLLLIAAETGLPIITSDLFIGHRREFSWLDGSDDAILAPHVRWDGEVALRHVTLDPRADWDMSFREEKDVLLQQGLMKRLDVLGRYWSCPEPTCPRHDPARKPFVLLPVAKGERLVCDLHGRDMVDQGPRPQMVQLKVMRDGREQRRFTVAEGTPAYVGRSSSVLDLSPFIVDDPHRLRVSRRHLRFDLSSDGLTVTDMSTHGTVLILRDGTEIDFRNASHAFRVGDRAQIRPGLEIIRSGRRFPSEQPAQFQHPLPPASFPPDATIRF